jgi:hypothetical protein
MIASETMPVKTIYANHQEQWTLVCEQCGQTKVLNGFDRRQIGKPLKVKCGCGHVFFLRLAERYYRKPTMLLGTYVKIGEHISQGLETGSMMVEDLSRMGLRLRTKIKHTIQVEDMIHVRFHLDDARHTEVNKVAVVKRVDAHGVDAAFLDFEAYNDANRALTLYVMAH